MIRKPPWEHVALWLQQVGRQKTETCLDFHFSVHLSPVVIVACKTQEPVVSKLLWLRATLHGALASGVIICQPITSTVTTAHHMCRQHGNDNCKNERFMDERWSFFGL